MDELLKAVLPGLGAFGPFAVLAWWIINNQAKQIEAKDAQVVSLNDKILNALNASTAALVDVKAELRQ